MDRMHIPYQYYFIALSMIVGFIALFQKRLPEHLWLFPFFLLFTLVVEIIGWRMAEKNENNVGLYNFVSVAASTYYMYLMLHMVYSRRARKVILGLMCFNMIISLINILFVQKMATFHTMTYSIGCLLIVMISMYYFYELFRVPRSIDLKKQPAFWIAAGLLFFYICTLPILGALNYLFTFPDVITGSVEQIITILNVLLYSLFTIGLLCRVSLKRSMS
jgi:hypothetical protein